MEKLTEQAMATQPLKTLTAYEENPFLQAIEPAMKRRTEILYDGKQAVIHRDTGEVQEDQLAIARIKWVESEQFVKVYTANMAVFFDLNKPAQRVCEFMVDTISNPQFMGRDQIPLYYQSYVKFCEQGDKKGSNKQSFNTGMRELATKALIAKSAMRDHWFINPAVIFNGDRARFITEVRKKRKSQAEIAEEAGQLRLGGID